MKKIKLTQIIVFTCLLTTYASTCSSDSKTSSQVNTTEQASEEKSETSTATTNSSNQESMTNVKAIIKTSMGDMTVQLYDETPAHRDNFVKLIKEGFYNDLLFHRVIQNFMIQGGDPNSKGAAPGTRLGSGGPGYTVEAEFNSKFVHKKGALSAARQGDAVNPEKRSSGSQFYIVQGTVYTPATLTDMQNRINGANPGINLNYNEDHIKSYTTVGGTPHLDMNYTVFGEVVEGLEVIDKIAAVQTAPGDRPVEDVKMSIELVE